GRKPGCGTHQYRQGLRRAFARLRGFREPGGRAAAARARQARAIRISQGDRISRQPADDHDRKGAAPGAAASRRGEKEERESMNADLIGSLASAFTTVAFVPQVWRAWKTRSARDLSLPMYLIFTTGVVLWLV